MSSPARLERHDRTKIKRLARPRGFVLQYSDMSTGGRPSRGSSRASRTIAIRLTDRESLSLDKLTEATGLTPSELVRGWLAQASGQGAQPETEAPRRPRTVPRAAQIEAPARPAVERPRPAELEPLPERAHLALVGSVEPAPLSGATPKIDPLLREQRAALAIALDNTERGGFPGSREWREEKAAMSALSAFDAAYPEVLAAIRAEHRAAVLPVGFRLTEPPQPAAAPTAYTPAPAPPPPATPGTLGALMQELPAPGPTETHAAYVARVAAERQAQAAQVEPPALYKQVDPLPLGVPRIRPADVHQANVDALVVELGRLGPTARIYDLVHAFAAQGRTRRDLHEALETLRLAGVVELPPESMAQAYPPAEQLLFLPGPRGSVRSQVRVIGALPTPEAAHGFRLTEPPQPAAAPAAAPVEPSKPVPSVSDEMGALVERTALAFEKGHRFTVDTPYSIASGSVRIDDVAIPIDRAWSLAGASEWPWEGGLKSPYYMGRVKVFREHLAHVLDKAEIAGNEARAKKQRMEQEFRTAQQEAPPESRFNLTGFSHERLPEASPVVVPEFRQTEPTPPPAVPAPPALLGLVARSAKGGHFYPATAGPPAKARVDTVRGSLVLHQQLKEDGTPQAQRVALSSVSGQPIASYLTFPQGSKLLALLASSEWADVGELAGQGVAPAVAQVRGLARALHENTPLPRGPNAEPLPVAPARQLSAAERTASLFEAGPAEPTGPSAAQVNAGQRAEALIVEMLAPKVGLRDPKARRLSIPILVRTLQGLEGMDVGTVWNAIRGLEARGVVIPQGNARGDDAGSPMLQLPGPMGVNFGWVSAGPTFRQLAREAREAEAPLGLFEAEPQPAPAGGLFDKPTAKVGPPRARSISEEVKLSIHQLHQPFSEEPEPSPPPRAVPPPPAPPAAVVKPPKASGQKETPGEKKRRRDDQARQLAGQVETTAKTLPEVQTTINALLALGGGTKPIYLPSLVAKLLGKLTGKAVIDAIESLTLGGFVTLTPIDRRLVPMGQRRHVIARNGDLMGYAQLIKVSLDKTNGRALLPLCREHKRPCASHGRGPLGDQPATGRGRGP